MNEMKQYIVKFEMLSEGLSDIVGLYNEQRSEEVIEDMESEIDHSHAQEYIYDAINDSYLGGS